MCVICDYPADAFVRRFGEYRFWLSVVAISEIDILENISYTDFVFALKTKSGVDRVLEPFISGRIGRIKHTFREDRDFFFYVVSGIFIGAASGIYTTVFNNYLNDVYQLTAGIRGALEFPREMPGALVMLVLGLLVFLGDIRIAILAMSACAVGLAGLGMFTQSFPIMIV